MPGQSVCSAPAVVLGYHIVWAQAYIPTHNKYGGTCVIVNTYNAVHGPYKGVISGRAVISEVDCTCTVNSGVPCRLLQPCDNL